MHLIPTAFEPCTSAPATGYRYPIISLPQHFFRHHLHWPSLGDLFLPKLRPCLFPRFTSSSIISMSSTREQIPPRRKRQRAEAGLSLDDQSESQPSKRLKSSTKLHSAAFYDSLSKVWLTRRALKELDRRTTQVNSPKRPASAIQRVYREDTLKQIRRFARHGGPELRDLRGVRPKCQS
jgi:hypothetical protein